MQQEKNLPALRVMWLRKPDAQSDSLNMVMFCHSESAEGLVAVSQLSQLVQEEHKTFLILQFLHYRRKHS